MVKTVREIVPRLRDRTPARSVARFTAQLVALCVPDRKDRVMRLAVQYGISQASVMRAIIDRGLPRLEDDLKSGKVDPTTLV